MKNFKSYKTRIPTVFLNAARNKTAGQLIRIAFVCGPDKKFINDIERIFSEYHETVYVDCTKQIDLSLIQKAINWADITWFEWCDQILIKSSNYLDKNSMIVCRIHSYEVFTEYPKQVSWDFVDHAIFVSKHIQEIFYQTHGIQIPSTIIPNAINISRYTYSERQNNKKIAYVGYLNYKKNPELLLQCMADIVESDNEYSLHIAGEYQDLRYKLYFTKMIEEMKLKDNIQFYGWISNVDRWLEDKSIIISTSILESFGMGIAEAMAKGIKPVIHNWFGAENIFPKKYLFNTVSDCTRMILSNEFNSQEYREYITNNYNLSLIYNQINSLFHTLLNYTFSCITLENEINLKPENVVILTGIPRSGTSLFSKILNNLENSVCLNEILYNIDSLPEDLMRIKARLLSGAPIPNRYEGRELTTDTQSKKARVAYRIVDKPIDQHVLIGSKVNIPYLNQIFKIIKHRYNIIALIRNPIFTIASWNRKENNKIPEAMVSDSLMHPRWRNFVFVSDQPLIRQAQIWETYAHLLYSLKEQILLIRYEDLTLDADESIEKVAVRLNRSYCGLPFNIMNMNIESRFGDLEQIGEVVVKYCPTATAFGYLRS
ncbi:hypothetical protein TRIP_B200578 [uncultured Desulfatiglans sp.]|uniref:Glycosyl transferase family 1 domain-containing protein n=1 Tax=Uncultured Desulfatiglans sp. TaxID=1748965 RepID=A0A653A3D6_UNCDX|nr:hypothetical protein TRIP_B200578 [uncultured Desulfatiglans sp.]